MEITINDCLNNDLIRQLLCTTQLTAIDFENISNNVVNFILLVLSDPVLEKYPLKTTYLTRFLKTIINQMENNGNELCDAMYLKYVELIQEQSNEKPFYKHYVLNEYVSNELVKSAIIIQESTSIVSQGTTGLCTWQAGIALSCWCLKNKDKLKNKFIVELGCGTGLSGISSCVNCEPKEYWFTDCHQTVLSVLKHNIQINETYHTFNCKYKIVELSWDNLDDFKIFNHKKPDLVLAADVVFDQTMFEPLCKSLKYFVSNKTTEIIMFCTLRNPETYSEFLKKLEKNNMNFIQAVMPQNYSIVLQQDCPIYILNIKPNKNIYNVL